MTYVMRQELLDRERADMFAGPYQPVRAVVGPMVSGWDIEDAVSRMLQAWVPAYLCECERQHGMTPGDTPAPKGWAITGRDLQKYPSDQLPCIVLMAGGVTATPDKTGPPGHYRSTWGVDVGAVFNAAWGRESRKHCQLYAASIRACLVQRPLAFTYYPSAIYAVDWRGEVYDEMDFADSRSYSASVCAFNVSVEGVTDARGGPPPDAVPPTDPTLPYEEWATVDEVDVTVTNTVEGPLEMEDA